jgi:transcriptional regulator with XRE-family HTH domain
MRLVEAVGLRIENLLKERKMTRYKLAKNGGIPRQTIAAIVQAKNKTVSLNIIFQIADTLGITMKEFFDDPLFKEVTE